MVFLENTAGYSWASVEDVEPLRALFVELMASALEPEPTRRLIREVIFGL